MTVKQINFLNYKDFKDFIEHQYSFDLIGTYRTPLKEPLVELIKNSYNFEGGETDFDDILTEIKNEVYKLDMREILTLTDNQQEHMADRFAVDCLRWHILEMGQEAEYVLDTYTGGCKLELFAAYAIDCLFNLHCNELKEACGYKEED